MSFFFSRLAVTRPSSLPSLLLLSPSTLPTSPRASPPRSLRLSHPDLRKCLERREGGGGVVCCSPWSVYHWPRIPFETEPRRRQIEVGRGGREEGARSLVACLPHLAIDAASLSRRSTVPTSSRDASYMWVVTAFWGFGRHTVGTHLAH